MNAQKFPINTINLLASLVAYNIEERDNNFYLYSRWCKNRLLPFDEQVDSKNLSKFFESIGCIYRDNIEYLFTFRANRLGEDEFVEYDSTNIACNSLHIPIVALGKGKDGTFRNQISFSSLTGSKKRMPVAYRYYNGNIHDSSTITDVINRFQNFKKIRGIVCDRGYSSINNILACLKLKINAIFAMKESSLTQESIDKFRDRLLSAKFDDRISNFNVYGIVDEKIIHDEDGSYTIYIYVFYDPIKREKENDKLQKTLELIEDAWNSNDKNIINDNQLEKYYVTPYGTPGKDTLCRDSSKIEHELKYSGFFVNTSTFKQTPQENLRVYVSRDGIEKYFKIEKLNIGHDTIRVHTLDTLMGRGLVYFISATIILELIDRLTKPLIYHQKNNKVKYSAPLSSNLSLIEFFKILKSVGIIYYQNGHVSLTEITKELKSILIRLDLKDLYKQFGIGIYI